MSTRLSALWTSASMHSALVPTLICTPISDTCHSYFCLPNIWLHQSNRSFLLLFYYGLPVTRFDPWDTPSQWTPPNFFLELIMHIAPPHTWRYSCMYSLCPFGSKFPPLRGLCLSGLFHSVSSLLLQLWLLHNLLRLLLRMHVEKLIAPSQQERNSIYIDLIPLECSACSTSLLLFAPTNTETE